MWSWAPSVVGWACGLGIGLYQGRRATKDVIARINQRACFYPKHTCLRLHEQAADIAATMREDEK